MNTNIIQLLDKELPKVLRRCCWDEYRCFGVPYARRSLEKYDSIGVGPASFKMAGKVCYFKKDFLDWLECKDFHKVH
ncbi:hypothetical protein [uncultured Pseudodesulfovibrio sp.]|uniref:hypothetical protein n=1 Tax=uncultured Pseudodesulfovibrio sp. TaxID=2035858 RepID=UPI0029C63D27|nr:hypothetical protein [uncultured Pseudodesulfovibrio sp.]